MFTEPIKFPPEDKRQSLNDDQQMALPFPGVQTIQAVQSGAMEPGATDLAQADELATEAEQQERDQAAEVDRDAGHSATTYEAELQTHIEAKQQQVERIESRLETMIEQQEARLLQTQQSKPGLLARPGTRTAWRERQDEQRARLQGLHARLDRVQSLREGMSTHGPKLEELATRKLRHEQPDLADEWDAAQALARREQLQRRQAKANEKQREQSRGMGLSMKADRA